jgi:hypothetical protein
MFINYTGSTYSLPLTTYESVDVYEMLTSGSTEQWVESHSSGTWTLRVPAGAIWGFGAAAGLTYSAPDPEDLLILLANDEDPWPQPPPPPPALFNTATDYADRYEAFLTARLNNLQSPPASPDKAA